MLVKYKLARIGHSFGERTYAVSSMYGRNDNAYLELSFRTRI